MSDKIELLKKQVKKGKNVFIAPNATVLGNVELGDEVSVWFGAVIRADRDKIFVGRRSNIQDNVVMHVDPGAAVVIGEEVIIGHSAIIHGAKIGNNTLIGMGSTLLNHCQIGKFCIIGANALITKNMVIPDFSLVTGSPARIIRNLTPEEIEKNRRNADVYVKLAREYMDDQG
jgi:carbonic anhydrase/acetyltransferase-like protein (isoleucine patch superfamily)